MDGFFDSAHKLTTMRQNRANVYQLLESSTTHYLYRGMQSKLSVQYLLLPLNCNFEFKCGIKLVELGNFDLLNQKHWMYFIYWQLMSMQFPVFLYSLDLPGGVCMCVYVGILLPPQYIRCTIYPYPLASYYNPFCT